MLISESSVLKRCHETLPLPPNGLRTVDLSLFRYTEALPPSRAAMKFDDALARQWANDHATTAVS